MEGWEARSALGEPDDRRHRHLRLGLVALAVLSVAVAVWYAAGLGERNAAAQQERIAASAHLFGAAVAGAEEVAGDLADGDIDQPGVVATSATRIAGRARELFDAAQSATSPAVAGLRLRATETAGRATELQSAVADAVAYDGVFSSLADPPELPVVIAAEDVASVASDIAWWATQARALADTLPENTTVAGHVKDVTELVDWLGGWQVAYLDALTAADAQSAAVERRALLERLDRLNTAWKEILERLGSRVHAELDDLDTNAQALAQPD